MNYSRLTVSLPEYLVAQVVQRVPKRGISRFVARAVSAQLGFGRIEGNDPWTHFFSAGKVVRSKNDLSVKDAINIGKI